MVLQFSMGCLLPMQEHTTTKETKKMTYVTKQVNKENELYTSY